MKIAVVCVGNRLMLDDGLGPAVYDELTEEYLFPENVTFFDAGCMTMDLLPVVKDYDFLLAVDAVDGTGEAPGTVFRFKPEDIADHPVMQSLHDLRLIDLLNAAALLGYDADGLCLGMQGANVSPAVVTEGLTPEVFAALPLMKDAVLAELWKLGVRFKHADGTDFVPPAADMDLPGAPCAVTTNEEVEFSYDETVNE